MEPKTKNPVSTLQFKKPPFFKSGLLIFEKSGHSLTLDGNYYRCSLNCKGRCESSTETRLGRAAFEKKFCRFAQRFQFNSTKVVDFLPNEFKKLLCKVIMKLNFSGFGEDVMDATARNMEYDAMGIKTERQRKKFEITNAAPGDGIINPKDIRTFRDGFISSERDQGLGTVFGYFFGVLMALTNPNNEREKGFTIAYIAKHIYISDDGKIQKIEFEPWGWHIMCYLERSLPGYLKGTKIEILNKTTITERGLFDSVEHFAIDEIDGGPLAKQAANLRNYFNILEGLLKSLSPSSPLTDQIKIIDTLKAVQALPQLRISTSLASTFLKPTKFRGKNISQEKKRQSTKL